MKFNFNKIPFNKIIISNSISIMSYYENKIITLTSKLRNFYPWLDIIYDYMFKEIFLRELKK